MRMLEFFLLVQLTKRGWPRRKGILRQKYVNSLLADTLIVQGLSALVGLGSGRPQIAVAMLFDTFRGNSWTEESTEDLFIGLRRAQDIVVSNPDMPPWQALWQEYRLSPYGEELGWSDLFDDRLGYVRAMAGSKAVFWGLTNHHQMQTVFERAKTAYETSSGDANQAGLGVSETYPFETLEHFYESGSDIFHSFLEAIPSLHGTMAVPWPKEPDISPRLRAMPEIARRLD